MLILLSSYFSSFIFYFCSSSSSLGFFFLLLILISFLLGLDHHLHDHHHHHTNHYSLSFLCFIHVINREKRNNFIEVRIALTFFLFDREESFIYFIYFQYLLLLLQAPEKGRVRITFDTVSIHEQDKLLLKRFHKWQRPYK